MNLENVSYHEQHIKYDIRYLVQVTTPKTGKLKREFRYKTYDEGLTALAEIKKQFKRDSVTLGKTWKEKFVTRLDLEKMVFNMVMNDMEVITSHTEFEVKNQIAHTDTRALLDYVKDNEP